MANGIAARGTQVFVAGQIGWDTERRLAQGDFVAQARQALLNIVVVLFVINFYFLGDLPLIGVLVLFSVLLSVFLGVYQSRAARRQVASS